jgi:glycosyltransferase involved in cell wall biosynthesis
MHKAMEPEIYQPLVSILMTAYNREKYIGEAIESVLHSTYRNWELIISDDCSSDSTLEIAHKYASEEQRVRVYKNEKNLGDYPNRNKAASFATGEYLMSVDSDDKLLPETIEQCINLFRLYPSANFGFYSPYYSEPKLLNPESTIHSHFFKNPLLLVGPGGSIIKTEFFKSIGGFPIKYGPANDGYYNLNAASKTDSIILPFEFIFYRRHEGQEINNKYGYLYNSYLYLNNALEEIDLPINKAQKLFLHNKNKRRFFVNIIKFYVTTLDFPRTRYAMKKAGFGVKDVLTALVQ